MGKKLFGFIFDFWEAALSFLGIAIMAFGAIYPLWQDGHITLNWAIVSGTILFVLFGVLAVAKGIRQGLELQRLQTLQQGTNNKVDGDGVAGQTVNRSPVAKNGGYASGGDMHITQNFFPPNNPQIISLPAISGNMEFRHPSPRLDPQGNETECKIVVINNSGQNFSKCAAYIAEVAHKSKKDKQWLVLSDVPSGQPLKWDSRFSSLDGFIGIDNGHQETLSLFEVKTKRYSKEGSTYNYFLAFYRSTIQLLHETATSHRILIRFHGGQTFGGTSIEKKIYVYLNENKPGFKVFAGVEEFKG